MKKFNIIRKAMLVTAAATSAVSLVGCSGEGGKTLDGAVVEPSAESVALLVKYTFTGTYTVDGDDADNCKVTIALDSSASTFTYVSTNTDDE